MATVVDGVGRDIAEIKINNSRVYPISHTEAVVYKEGAVGSGKFLNEKISEIDNTTDALDDRLSSVEDLAEISISGGTIQIGNTASDIASGSSKVPTGNAVYAKLVEENNKLRTIPFALPQYIDLYPGDTTNIFIYVQAGMQLLVYATTVEGTDPGGDEIDFSMKVGSSYIINYGDSVNEGYNIYYGVIEPENAYQYKGIRELTITSVLGSGDTGRHIKGWIMPIYDVPLATFTSRGLMSKEDKAKLTNIDTIPTSGSNNFVKSGGVYLFSAEVGDLIDTVD